MLLPEDLSSQNVSGEGAGEAGGSDAVRPGRRRSCACAADGIRRPPAEGAAPDPFGQAVLCCHTAGARAGHSFVTYEWSDGLVQHEDAAKYFAGPAAWHPLDRHACIRATGRILDVGCGPGRHACALRRAGHDVTGVDASPGAVRVAVARGIDARTAQVERLPGGLGLFDTILLLGNNLSLLGPPDRARSVLTALAAAAAPGAALWGRATPPRTFDAPAHRPATPSAVRIRHADITGPWRPYHLPTPREITSAAEKTPWSLRGVTHHGTSCLVELTLPRGPVVT